jgi:hypothetical protein
VLALLAALSTLAAQGAGAAGVVGQPGPTTPVGGVDPDTLPKGSADAVVIVRWLSPGLYQLEVQNTSGIGAINSFNWVAPVNLQVTAVTSSEGGKCSLAGGNIQCTTDLVAPACTCDGGGVMTVNFTATGLNPTYANGYWTYYGIVGSYLQIESMTPVPYHVPSYQSPQSQDLPVCAKGHTSTKTHPCVKPQV